MDSSTSNAVIQALLDDIDRLKLAVPKATLPGKLGNSTMQLKDDPRADPRMVAKMAELGLDVDPAKPPVDMNSSSEELLAFAAGAEAGFEGIGPAFYATPREKQVEVVDEEKTIKGVDGNDIKLYIHYPKGNTRALPCVLHTHGKYL
jgi:hypothetical protein